MYFDSLYILWQAALLSLARLRIIPGCLVSQSQSSTGDLGDITGIEGQSGKEMCQGGKPDTAKLVTPSYIGMNVYGSARMCVTAAATYTDNCYNYNTTQSE